MEYFVRVGCFGHVGRMRAQRLSHYSAAQRVICRTERGLEIGEVLSSATPLPSDQFPSQINNEQNPSATNPVAEPTTVVRLDQDGEIVRCMTTEDELVRARLDRHRSRAIRACQRKLAELNQSHVTLLDAELLFDGRSLFFYFLGEVGPEIEAMTNELAETYEAKARIGDFAKLMETGCGPGCGTDEGGGCSTGADGAGGCAGCSTGGCLSK